MAKRERDYLKRRGGVWYLRFQYPEPVRQSAMHMYGAAQWPKDRALSLGTTDYLEAKRLAAPIITEHLDLLAYHRGINDPTSEFEEQYEIEPYTKHTKPDGTLVTTTDYEIVEHAPDGSVTQRPNVVGFRVVPKKKVTREERFSLASKVVRTDDDTFLIGRYADTLKRKDDGKLALATLHRFKKFRNKPITKCRKIDVIDFICSELESEADDALSYPRLKKGVAFLSAAINHLTSVVADCPYTTNPFAQIPWANSKIIPQHTEKPKITFDENDVDLIMSRIHEAHPEIQLMIITHLATGVRPVGIFNINMGGWHVEIETSGTGRVLGEHRTRFWQIDKDKDKTGTLGRRFIPVPQAVIDHFPDLPETFNGSLFSSKSQDALRLGCAAFLKKLGFQEQGKSLFSGRHRARSRFSSVGCPENISEHILGHADSRGNGGGRRGSTHHRGYGGEYCFVLKRWIDHVGCSRLTTN